METNLKGKVVAMDTPVSLEASVPGASRIEIQFAPDLPNGAADLEKLPSVNSVRALGSGVVALAGTGPDGVKAGIAVAVSKDLTERGIAADALARPAAKALGGGVGKGTDAVVGGGANAAGIDEALRLVREQITTLTR